MVVRVMVWYVAVVAIVNFALGYALALVLGAGRGQVALAGSDAFESTGVATLEE
jgi:hypothetical protein